MKLKDLIIGLDFDGTCVIHDFPSIGKELPGCIDTLKKAMDQGAKICLNTMRSGKYLDEAVKWLLQRGIDLYGINVNPTQKEWTSSPKVYAHLYIDDAALGCPLIFDHGRPCADWTYISKLLFGKDHRIEAIIIEQENMPD